MPNLKGFFAFIAVWIVGMTGGVRLAVTAANSGSDALSRSALFSELNRAWRENGERGPAGQPDVERFITDYEDIIRVRAYSFRSHLPLMKDVQGSNQGLVSYSQDILRSDPSFAEKAQFFYLKVMKADADFYSSHPADPMASRARLADKAGQGRFKKLQPGWLWKLALETAGGDPPLALRLIGICGQDDRDNTMDLPPNTPDNPERVALQKSLVEIYEARAETARKNLERFETDRANIESGAVGLKKTQAEAASNHIVCPSRESVFFVPQSLGADADLSEDQKMEFSKREGAAWTPPADAAEASVRLPAKQYHVYGAAFVACEMMVRGHDPGKVVEAQKIIARYYRTQWFNRFFSGAAPSENGEQSDALELLRRWTIGGGIGLPSGIEAFGAPKADSNTNDFLYRIQKPNGWTDERYAKAKKRFESYITDFNWTIAEHEAGANFARRHCHHKNGASAGGAGVTISSESRRTD